jgi:hypothetical protein
MMAQYNNPNAADGRKSLVLSSRLFAAAGWERYALLYCQTCVENAAADVRLGMTSSNLPIACASLDMKKMRMAMLIAFHQMMIRLWG